MEDVIEQQAPARLRPETRQERRSLNEIEDRLFEFGWKPTRETTDLGEDLTVHVHIAGRATGIIFFVQAKSVSDLAACRRDEHLIYDLPIKDVLHWERFHLPVVLVVWDVNRRGGRWALLSELICDLDARRSGWRENTHSVRVYVPWGQALDDRGLRMLQREIGRRVLPLLSRDVSAGGWELRFLDTEDGRRARAEVRTAVQHRQPVTVDASALDVPRNWQFLADWFFDGNRSSVKLRLDPETPAVIRVRFEMLPAGGRRTVLGPVDMYVPKHGMGYAEACSITDQMTPDIKLALDAADGARLSVEGWGGDVYSAHQVLRFQHAISSGGILRVRHMDAPGVLEFELTPEPQIRPPAELVAVVDDLAAIQDATGVSLQIPDDGIPPRDVARAREIVKVITTGRLKPSAVQAEVVTSAECLKNYLGLDTEDRSVLLVEEDPGRTVDILGATVDLGRLVRRATGQLRPTREELARMVEAAASDGPITLEIEQLEVTEYYLQWYEREARRLARLLEQHRAVEQVFLFGSVVWSPRSIVTGDLDLAVVGLSADHFYEAASLVERESSFDVDLVMLSSLPDELQRRIRDEGRAL